MMEVADFLQWVVPWKVTDLAMTRPVLPRRRQCCIALVVNIPFSGLDRWLISWFWQKA
jgi:hypothetical protein